jgi:hypothetical protein
MQNETKNTTKKQPLLLPFFEQSITKSYCHGTAKKYDKRSGRDDTRYFELKVIATDKKGVYFEAWSGEASNTCKNRYHGTTYVDLTNVTSYVEAQMIACKQLPNSFNKEDYVA